MKLRISIKILLALLALSFISLILFGYIALRGMKELGRYALESNTSLGNQAVTDSIEALESQAERYLLQLAEDQAALSNTLLKKVEDEVNIIASFASNLWRSPLVSEHKDSYSQKEKPPDIRLFSSYKLAPGISVGSVEEELNLSSKLDEIFIPVYANNSNLDCLCLGTKSGIFRGYPWMSGIAPSYDPRKRCWYEEAVKTGKISWSEPYVHAATKELIVTCSKPFYDAGDKLLGVVEADVTLNVMNENILSTQIGKLGYAFLLDDKGNIIAHPGLRAGGTKWDEAYLTQNLLQSNSEELRKIVRDMISGHSGVCRFSGDPTKSGGDEKYIAYASIACTGWSLGILMPVKEIVAPALTTRNKIVSATKNTARYINEQIKNMLSIGISIFVGIMVIVFVIAYWLSRRITRPILSLNEGVKVVGGGNLDYHLKIKTGDEIEDLAGAFNKMTQDLKTYIKNLKETTQAKQKIESELKIAHDIQMGIVPKKFPPFPQRKEFDIYAVLKPAREVGGDLYDFFFIDDEHFCFVIGDVAGKGVPAALLMAVTTTLIKTIAGEVGSPDKILERVNKEISRDNDRCMFVTVFCGILNIKSGQVTYTNAGHNPPLIIRLGEEPQFLKGAEGAAVGLDEEASYKKETLNLRAGDAIYMYTDGVTEAANKKEKLYSEEKLKEQVSGHRQESIKKLVKTTLEDIELFSSDMPQSDDITIMVLRYFHNNKVEK